MYTYKCSYSKSLPCSFFFFFLQKIIKRQALYKGGRPWDKKNKHCIFIISSYFFHFFHLSSSITILFFTYTKSRHSRLCLFPSLFLFLLKKKESSLFLQIPSLVWRGLNDYFPEGWRCCSFFNIIIVIIVLFWIIYFILTSSKGVEKNNKPPPNI